MKREWLITLRNEKGYSQEKLSEMIGVTQMTISNVENGSRRPSVELAKKLGTLLDFEWTKFYE